MYSLDDSQFFAIVCGIMACYCLLKESLVDDKYKVGWSSGGMILFVLSTSVALLSVT